MCCVGDCGHMKLSVFISVMHAFLGRCRSIILVMSGGNVSQTPQLELAVETLRKYILASILCLFVFYKMTDFGGISPGKCAALAQNYCMTLYNVWVLK